MFDVVIMNSVLGRSEEILYEGKCRTVLLPGETGEFEILDFHKPIISRLKKGYIVVDNQEEYLIQGGIVKMSQQKLVAMVEI